MKKILLIALIAVTAQNALAAPTGIAKKNLCVNLMVTAESYMQASKLGMPKSEVRSIIDKYDMQELYPLLDLIYHPSTQNGKTDKVWEFVYDRCENPTK